MTDKKKPLAGATTNGINKNTETDYIINSYLTASQFFKKREQYHRDASLWYLTESDLMLNKADQEIQRAEICADNRSQYLQLAGIAVAKSSGWLND